MTATPGSDDLLLFDGDCGICSAAADLARKIARHSGYVVQPYQMFPEEELRKWGIDYDACSKKIHSITRDGKVYAGAFSVNHFCWRHPRWRIIPLIIYLIPPLLLAEIGLYALVAHNRTRISGWLGLNACIIREH